MLYPISCAFSAALPGEKSYRHQIGEDVILLQFFRVSGIRLHHLHEHGSFSRGNENRCQPGKVQSTLSEPQGQTKQH